MDESNTSDAMAAMGLPTSFSTPNATRNAPSGPSNSSSSGGNRAGSRGRGGSRGDHRGRGSGNRSGQNRGRGDARGHPYYHSNRQEPLYSNQRVNSTPYTKLSQHGFGANNRGSESNRFNRNHESRQRGIDLNAIMNQPLLPFEEIGECLTLPKWIECVHLNYCY